MVRATSAQSDQSDCLPLKYFISIKLLAEHHLEFLSLEGGLKASSESTHVKMAHCWKSHVANDITQVVTWRGVDIEFKRKILKI